MIEDPSVRKGTTIFVGNVDLRSSGYRDYRWMLPFLFGMLVFAYSMSNFANYVLSDPDTFMHIASGTWMIEHHQVPSVDPFSYNTNGLKWIAHEWLAQIIMAIAYDWGGFYGLRVLVASLFSLTIGYQLTFLLKRIPAIYAIFFSALCFASLLGHHLARPHIFTWPILLFWLAALINKVDEGRLEAPYYLAPVIVLWANLHGSFILGLMIIPFFGLEAYLNAEKDYKNKVMRSWVLFFFLSFICSLITPYGVEGILFGTHLVSAQFTSSIIEWVPASGYSLLPIECWVILIISMGLTGYLRLPVIRILLLVGFIHESLAHVRYISILGLVTPLLIAKSFGDLYRQKLAARNPERIQRNGWGKKDNTNIRVVIFSGVLMLLSLTLFAGRKYQENILDPVTAPETAVEFAKNEGLNGNVLNYYNMGGFLIYKQIPVIIDGRADLYGQAKISEYFSVLNLENESQVMNYLSDHQIAWTIFPPAEKIVHYLNSQPKWRKVYEDKYAVIHARQ
jgi:hypothetical protein